MQKMCSILLSLSMMTLLIVPVQADSTNNSLETMNSYDFQEKTESERIALVKEEARVKWGLDSTEGINVYSESNISDAKSYIQTRGTTYLGSQTKYIRMGRVGNQLPNGVSSNYGGELYWQDGGSTIAVTFAIKASIFSVGVSIGNKVKSSEYRANYPAGGRYVLHANKEVRVKRYYVERYQGAGVWYRDYLNVQELLGVDLFAIRV